MEEDAIEEASSNNIANKVSRRELFKLFLYSLEWVKTSITLNLPLITIALVMNVPPIMAIPSTNALEIQLPKYHNNEDLILHIR